MNIFINASDRVILLIVIIIFHTSFNLCFSLLQIYDPFLLIIRHLLTKYLLLIGNESFDHCQFLSEKIIEGGQAAGSELKYEAVDQR